MNIKVQYSTDEERENLIQEHSELFLIEEQNITEGNFLIFAEEFPKSVPISLTPEQQRIKELEDQLLLMADAETGGIL